MRNDISKLDIELLLIQLQKQVSIEDDSIAEKVVKHFFENDHSMIWDQLKDENNFLRKELHRLKNSKPKPKTYKNMVRNSLGNANFNVDKLASYLNNCPTGNLIIIEYIDTAAKQLIDLIHILGVNNGK